MKHRFKVVVAESRPDSLFFTCRGWGCPVGVLIDREILHKIMLHGDRRLEHFNLDPAECNAYWQDGGLPVI
jgi:hypothetical protein